MIKTRRGWERATLKQKKAEIEILSMLPTAFQCTCNQCGCGCFQTVIYGGIPRCPTCGRIKQDIHGRYYGLGHLEICKNRNDPISNETRKAKEALIKQGKYTLFGG